MSDIEKNLSSVQLGVDMIQRAESTQNGDILNIDPGDGKHVVIEDAAAYISIHKHEWGNYTEVETKQVLRRIDWKLMPLFIITLTFAGIDKIIISNAAVYGMNKDLSLKGQEYSWSVSIFYFGYMVATYPANAIMQRFPVGRCLALACIGWGAAVAFVAASPNFGVLMFLRFIMGVFEAFLFPSMTILISMWYTKKEQPLRSAITFTSFSTLISGPVSYGIGQTHTSVAPWRLLFITLGGATILWGVVLAFTIPDSPLQENFMKGKEKYIALDRVKDNMTGIENREFKWYQVKEAFLDYKTYVLFFFYLCMNVPTGGLSAFAAQIISGIGNSPLSSVLLTMPCSPFQTVASLAVAIPQRWLNNKRCLSSAICCLIPLACSILIRKLPEENKNGRLLAYYFFYFFWGPYATALSLPMANVSGHTKKLTVTGSIFVAYCTAMIIGPQVFLEREAPTYETGYNSLMGFEIGAISMLAVYAIGCTIENNQRDKREGTDIVLDDNEMIEDKTDYEKRAFRYVY